MRNNVKIFTKNGMFASMAMDKGIVEQKDLTTAMFVIGRFDLQANPAYAYQTVEGISPAAQLFDQKKQETIKNGWKLAYQGDRNFG